MLEKGTVIEIKLAAGSSEHRERCLKFLNFQCKFTQLPNAYTNMHVIDFEIMVDGYRSLRFPDTTFIYI